MRKNLRYHMDGLKIPSNFVNTITSASHELLISFYSNAFVMLGQTKDSIPLTMKSAYMFQVLPVPLYAKKKNGFRCLSLFIFGYHCRCF